MKTLIARYEVKGGKRYLSLYREIFKDKNSYHYEGTNCGGNLGYKDNDKEAVKDFENNQVRYMKMDFPSTERTLLIPRGISQ